MEARKFFAKARKFSTGAKKFRGELDVFGSRSSLLATRFDVNASLHVRIGSKHNL